MSINMIYHCFDTKKIILIGVISIFSIMAGCTTPKYYARMDKIGDEQKVCFFQGVPEYMQKLGSDEDFLDLAIKRINVNFAGKAGIYHSVFKNYDPNLPAKAQPCSDSYEEKTSKYDVNAIASFFSQPLTKPPEEKKKPESLPCTPTGEKNQPCTKAPDEKPKPEKQPAAQAGEKNDDDTLLKEVQWVVSSYLYTLNPAHRLDKVYTLVTPIHPGVELIGTEEVYEKELIKLASETTTAGITGAIGTPANMPVDVKISPSFQRAIQRDLSRKYVVKNAEIFPLRNVLLISQDGGPAGAGIGGNAEVNVTISLPSDLCQYFTVFKKAETKSDEKKYEPHPLCYIDSVKGLVASLIVARVVTEGDETVKEDDDWVTPVAFRNIQVTDLWKNPRSLFGIRMNVSGSSYPVRFKGMDKLSPLLVFGNLEDALAFRDWLVKKVLADGKQADFANGSLNWKDAEDASIKIGLFKEVDLSKIQTNDFQICKAGLSAPNLEEYSIPRPRDLCESN